MLSIGGLDEAVVTALFENAVNVCREGKPVSARIKCGQAFSGSSSG